MKTTAGQQSPWRSRGKQILAAVVLLLTIALFTRYFAQHPEYLRRLAHISPWTVVWVLLLNAVMVGVLVLMTQATIRLCGKRLGWHENFLLTAYSSIANFFGPLQSGPGVRAVYLKSRHQIRLRDYTLASLLALGLFACFSALFLLVGMRPWWQTIGLLVVVVVISSLVIRLFRKRDKQASESQFRLQGGPLGALFALTFLQVVLTIGWYYVELKAVDPHIHLSQAMSYAGAANFALFVSVTPDAVGIREAFLVFSQHIHHVSTADIAAANVIDRAVYACFLLLLFGLVLGLHAKTKLQITRSRRVAAES